MAVSINMLIYLLDILSKDIQIKRLCWTSTVLPQEQIDKKEVPLLRSKGPPRQDQEWSAEESARVSHVGDRLAVLTIKGPPHQTSALERLEQEDYGDEEEQENFEDDLKSILNELQIDVDNYEE